MSNIKYKIIPLDTLYVQVERVIFGTGVGPNEIHAMVHLTPDFPADQDPIDYLLEAKMVLEQFLGARTFFGRLFLSQEIAPREGIKGLSCIIQPPLDGTPAALMLWMLQGSTDGVFTSTKNELNNETIKALKIAETRIDYDDRCHLLVHGSASTDNQGETLFPNDPEQQTRSMLDNLQARLDENGASLRDLMHAVVYLHRAEDYAVVQRVLQEVVPDLPKVILLTTASQPGCLVQMEGVAVIPNGKPQCTSFQ